MPTSKVELSSPFRCADITCAFGSVINVEDLGALSTLFGVAPGQLYETLGQLAARGATGTAIGLAQHQLETLTNDHFDLIELATGGRYIPHYFKFSERKLADLKWLHVFAFTEQSKHDLHDAIILARDLNGLGIAAPDLDHPPAIANMEELSDALNLITESTFSATIFELTQIDGGHIKSIATEKARCHYSSSKARIVGATGVDNLGRGQRARGESATKIAR